MAYTADHVTCEDGTIDPERTATINFYDVMRAWGEHQEKADTSNLQAVMDSWKIDKEKVAAINVQEFTRADGTIDREMLAILSLDLTADDDTDSEDSLGWFYDSD